MESRIRLGKHILPLLLEVFKRK